jgi:trimethylamine:corrinoid methyltransferase-like protein
MEDDVTSKNQFPVNAKFVQNSEIVFSQMDDEIVMMDLEKGEYYGISPVGSRIWELVETPRTMPDICTTLCKEYDVSHEKCTKEVLDFIIEMTEKNIITTIDESSE